MENQLLNRVDSNLTQVEPVFWQNLAQTISEELKDKQGRNDDAAANRLWFLKTHCIARGKYLEAISLINNCKYFDAWCLLEEVENLCISLITNPFFNIIKHKVKNLHNLVLEWQKSFPYDLFISPEFLVKREKCNICKDYISPWSECNHEVGVVYNGEICVRIAEDIKLISLSIVKDPVQKYSALHTYKGPSGEDIERFTYETVKFIANKVTSPFQQFEVRWTRAPHSHDLFTDRPVWGPCPCESGLKYSACCLNRDGVLRPHMHVEFEGPVMDSGPNPTLIGYSHTQ